MLEFKDISMELARTYTFPGGDTVTIHEPLKLHVSDSGVTASSTKQDRHTTSQHAGFTFRGPSRMAPS